MAIKMTHTNASIDARVCHAPMLVIEELGNAIEVHVPSTMLASVVITIMGTNFLLHMNVYAHESEIDPAMMQWSATKYHGGAPGAQKSWKMPMVAKVDAMPIDSCTRACVERPFQKSVF